MTTRRLQERVALFAGINDRDLPSQVSRWECPDLRNVDFYHGTLRRRNGYTRVNATPFRDASIRLDGSSDYFRIPDISAYDVSGDNEAFYSIDLIMREVLFHESGTPAAGDRTIFTKGFDDGITFTSRELKLFYDVSLNSGAGGWSVVAWDSDGGGGLRTWTVNDDYEFLTGQYRHIEFGWFDTGYELRVYEEDGTLVGSDTTADITTWTNVAEPIFLGVDMASSDSPDTQYTAVSIAEFRVSVFDSTTYTTGCPISHEVATGGVAGRELNPRLGEENSAFLTGYWKCNDGNGAQITDTSTNGNTAELASSPPTWETDGSLVLGQSGIRFHGKAGFVHWIFAQADVDLYFKDTTVASNGSIWSVELIHVPLAEADETTIRDSTILWAGTDATNPAPIGLRVVSNKYEATYYDGASTRTINDVLNASAASINLYNERGKRIRIRISMQRQAGLNHYFGMSVYVEGGDTYGATAAAISGQGASGVSTDWFIGRTVTSTTFPFTYSAAANSHNPIYGIVDDLRLVWGDQTVLSVPLGNQLAGGNWFSEIQQGISSISNTAIRANLLMNEEEGNELFSVGSFSTRAYIYPETSEGPAWDHGLVEPYRAPEGRGIFDYRRFTQDIAGTAQRDALIVTGCTLSSVNMSDGAVTIVGGGLNKGGPVTITQYEGIVYIGTRSKRRPFQWNGTSLTPLGTNPPRVAMSSFTVNTSGSLAAGTYNVYYTFVDADKKESNPSPLANVTVSANGRITGFNVPTSPEPHVQDRYVYMNSAAGLSDGSVAYRIYTVGDNSTTAVSSLTIDTVDTSEPTLEYFDNGPPPAGGVLQIFNDRLFIGGVTREPTRVYFSKSASPSQFDRVDDFVGLDTDAGDPVVALVPRTTVLTAYTRDSRWDLWTTGIAADPVDRNPVNSSTGSVGPLAAIENARGHIFVGERGIFVTDGYNDQSLSSPPRRPPGQPQSSIQTLLRESVADNRREYSSVTFHRGKDQIWATFTSSGESRHDVVVVYDFSRGTWSRYDLCADIIAEIEDSTDSPHPYGIIEGHLCKLDDTSTFYDGTTALTSGVAEAGGSTTQIVSTGLFTGKTLKGLKVWVYHKTGNTVESGIISYHDDDNLYLYDALSASVASGDIVAVAVFPFYADFVVAASQLTRLKRGKWLTFAARSNNDLNNFQVLVSPNDVSKSPDFDETTIIARSLGTKSGLDNVRVRLPLPGLTQAWRIRLSDTALTEASVATTARPSDAVPGIYFTEIMEMVADFAVTDAR